MKSIQLSVIGRTRRRVIGLLIAAVGCGPASAQIGLWTSAAELADMPMSGLPWESVMTAADEADPSMAFVSNQNNNNNVQILAAAIVYARTGDETCKNKVTAACEKLAVAGYPALAPGIAEEDNRTLAWARETGAYALAADLVGHRTAEFETWLRSMAEEYVAYDNRTLLYMFHLRPNNWGTHAFGSLCAIYAYLQDTTSLAGVRDYWIQAVTGPKPDELEYGGPEPLDLSWHVDQTDLRLINPKGAEKQGLNIDGIMPDDMRRHGSFSNPPIPKPGVSYHWGALQGQVSGGRILERMGMPIWDVADSALYRAGYALQVRWEHDFGGWKAEGDDLWLLPFFDDTYGTDWSAGQPERVWQHGKNAGWPYVVWDGTLENRENHGSLTPGIYELRQNYPNPFNPVTQISLSIAETGPVHLAVYDLVGREVSTLLDGVEETGEYTLVWEAVDREGTQLPSGIYLCSLLAGYCQKTLKMTVLR